jgi:hypothetical protein
MPYWRGAQLKHRDDFTFTLLVKALLNKHTVKSNNAMIHNDYNGDPDDMGIIKCQVMVSCNRANFHTMLLDAIGSKDSHRNE